MSLDNGTLYIPSLSTYNKKASDAQKVISGTEGNRFSINWQFLKHECSQFDRSAKLVRIRPKLLYQHIDDSFEVMSSGTNHHGSNDTSMFHTFRLFINRCTKYLGDGNIRLLISCQQCLSYFYTVCTMMEMSRFSVLD
ncbi:hypothetical protein EDC96DRAFT_545436 [Choanephora cucurbitarum]|nr:hypothetical protein EDC96DRAFT_545436 [Choanephora cucurbitarum]